RLGELRRHVPALFALVHPVRHRRAPHLRRPRVEVHSPERTRRPDLGDDLPAPAQPAIHVFLEDRRHGFPFLAIRSRYFAYLCWMSMLTCSGVNPSSASFSNRSRSGASTPCESRKK